MAAIASPQPLFGHDYDYHDDEGEYVKILTKPTRDVRRMLSVTPSLIIYIRAEQEAQKIRFNP